MNISAMLSMLKVIKIVMKLLNDNEIHMYIYGTADFKID